MRSMRIRNYNLGRFCKRLLRIHRFAESEIEELEMRRDKEGLSISQVNKKAYEERVRNGR
jgi:hypothetical protein